MQFYVESLRVSVFTGQFGDLRQVPIDEWWKRATGADPAQVTRNVAMAQLAAEGQFADGRLSVVVTPGRIDWQVSSVPARAPEWPRLGPWPDYIPRLVNPVKDWLGSFGVTNRIAFGAVVVGIVDDRDTGYRAVEAALSDLGLKLPSLEVTDFLLQFNKPIDSREGPTGLLLNRLSRWSVAVLKPVIYQVMIGGAGAPPIPPEPTSHPDSHAVRVELDFSTQADWSRQLTAEQGRSLLDELVSRAIDYLKERVKV